MERLGLIEAEAWGALAEKPVLLTHQSWESELGSEHNRSDDSIPEACFSGVVGQGQGSRPWAAVIRGSYEVIWGSPAREAEV